MCSAFSARPLNLSRKSSCSTVCSRSTAGGRPILKDPKQMSPPSLIQASAPLTQSAPIALSYELFPPRNAAAEAGLWDTIRELETTNPDYVSVTYGASGSNRDTAVDLLNRLLTETSLRPLAHLTCVGNTADELAEIISELLDHGVRGILA